MSKDWVKISVLLISFLFIGAVLLSSGGINNSAVGSATFLEQFLFAGGPIVWFVLLPMSVLSVYLSIEHGISVRRTKLIPAGWREEIMEILRQPGAGKAGRIGEKDDLISYALSAGVGCRSSKKMRSICESRLGELVNVHLRRLEWLNLIGNIAPMVGLFGTVFGMIKLFNAIVVAGGQPQPAHLAGGISVALVTTLWGLLVAIPSLAVYGYFRNKLEQIGDEAAGEIEKVIEFMTVKSGFDGKNGPVIRPMIQEVPKKKKREIRKSISL